MNVFSLSFGWSCNKQKLVVTLVVRLFVVGKLKTNIVVVAMTMHLLIGVASCTELLYVATIIVVVVVAGGDVLNCW